MGATVITITSGKGGVGKTTTTANLGLGLAKLGKKVVVIDTDIGLRNLDIILGLESRVVYDLVDIIEGNCKLRQAMIKHKEFPDFYLIPAAQKRDKTAVSPANMIEITNALRHEFDFILVDSPAGIERGFRNAVAAADMVVIVTNAEVSAVRDADRVIGLVEASIRQSTPQSAPFPKLVDPTLDDGSEEDTVPMKSLSNPNSYPMTANTNSKPSNKKTPIMLILNRVRIDMIQRGEMLSVEDVKDVLAIKVLGIVPEDPQVIPASNTGVPIVMHENAQAGKAYMNIARRIMGEDVPFMQLEQKGLFQRLSSLLTGGQSPRND